MLVIANGRTETVCSHPSLLKQGKEVYCPDCEQRFSSRTKVYKRFISHEPSQTLPPKKTTTSSDSNQPTNQQATDQPHRTVTSGGKSSHTGLDSRGKDKTPQRRVLRKRTPRTADPGDPNSWNNSPEGVAFWARVDLIWPFLTNEERHHVYFTKKVDYPRLPYRLESFEARGYPICKPFEAYDSPRNCVYQCRNKVSYPAIAFGELMIAGKVFIRLHYQKTETDPVQETDTNIKFVQWTPVDPLTELEQERDRLAKAAEFAPDNGWIETGKVQGKSFRQAWWRGKYSQGKKTIYIGKVGSSEYAKARNAQKARKELKKVLRQIKTLKRE